MRLLHHIPIRIKVLIPLMVLILTMGGVLILVKQGLELQRDAGIRTGDIRETELDRIDAFIDLGEKIRSNLFQLTMMGFLDSEELEIETLRNQMVREVNQLDRMYEQILESWVLDAAGRELAIEMGKPLESLRRSVLEALRLIRGDPAMDEGPVRDAVISLNEFRKVLFDFNNYYVEKVRASEAEADRSMHQTVAGITIVTVLVAMIGIFLAMLIGEQSIAGPISRITEQMNRLANGAPVSPMANLDRRDEIGAMARAFEVFRKNAVEKIRAEDRLRESETRFRLFMDHSPSLAWIRGPDGRYVYLSNTHEQFFGIDVDTCVGTRGEGFFPEETLSEFRRNDREVILRGEAMSFIEETRAPDGSRCFWWVNKFPFHDAAGVCYLGGIALDITRRRMAEEKLKEYSRRLEEMVEARTRELQAAQDQLLMKERLAVLGHFSGSISHEMRNPLGVIDSSVYFLKMKLGNADETIDRHLSRISESVRKSTAIIESMLDLTRLKAPVLERHDLTDFVWRTLNSEEVPEGIELLMNFSDESIPVRFDVRQLEMAIGNIFRNACDAMNNAGTLSITIKTLETGTASIVVEDTGPGVPDESREKIFEPLFSTKGSGIGFGLSITRMIVENHGGTVRAGTAPGGGAAFIVNLPIAENGEETTHA